MYKNKFIRITLILAVVIIVLLVSVFGYLKYRQYISYKLGVHKNAALIFRINADQIYTKLFNDYLSNSAYYKNHNKYLDLNTGLKIPANVFIYNISDKSFDTFFCLMPVANLENLKFFLKNKLKVNAIAGQEPGFNFATSSDNKITVAYNDQRVAIAYSFKKEAVVQVLIQMLKGEHILQFDDRRLSGLRVSKADVAYTCAQYEGIGNFDDGKITFDGDFSSKYLKSNHGSLSRRKFSRSAPLKMWLNIDLSRLPFDKIQFKNAKLNMDSLIKYKIGYADLEVDGHIKQLDTVITYDYNEDFEKVENATTKEVFVPNVVFSLSSDAPPLAKHLNREHIIGDNGTFNKTLFPLYDIYRFAETDEFKLSTSKEVISSTEREETPYFFGLEMNFGFFSGKSSSLSLKKIGALKSLTIFAKEKNNDANRFEAILQFKQSNINGLIQLF
ncbi:hypothetical protein [Pedobacter frigoris]|uniref:Uncharacterized protein n=1 Tax=Pedobacter frigoris TaxID=2571272 RepID=A0A4U1CU83_9SPHI|nr:hypothetical protein [Pedobacter frigoris]TKC09559.1 hypothetical protein FA047_05585 [Pedobacter frigoris]